MNVRVPNNDNTQNAMYVCMCKIHRDLFGSRSERDRREKQ